MIRFNKNTQELYKLGVLNEDDYNTPFSNQLLIYIKTIEKEYRKDLFQQIKNFTDLQIRCLQEGVDINITKQIKCEYTLELYQLGVLNEDDYNKSFSENLPIYIKSIEEKNRKKIFQKYKKCKYIQIACLIEGIDANIAMQIYSFVTKDLYKLGVFNKDEYDYNETSGDPLIIYIERIEEEYRKDLFQQIKFFDYKQIYDLEAFFDDKPNLKPVQCLFYKENLLDYLKIIGIYKPDAQSIDNDIDKNDSENFNKFNDTIALIKENKIPISRLMSITKDCETITRNSFFSLLLNRNTTFEIPFEVINLLNDNSKLESIISIVTHSKIEEYHFKKIFPKYDYLFFEKEFIINMLMDLTGLNYEICINMASYLNIQDFEGVILPTEKEFINARESNNKGKLLNSWQETIKHQEENKEKINYIQR